MKGATEELFVKVTYYKKRGGPWEPSMALYYAYPSVLLTKFFSRIKEF